MLTITLFSLNLLEYVMQYSPAVHCSRYHILYDDKDVVIHVVIITVLANLEVM